MTAKDKLEIKDKIYYITKQSVELRKIAKDDKLNYETSTKLNKKQQELWNKINFYKNLYNKLKENKDEKKHKIN